MRLAALDAKPLWLDEAFSLWLASHPSPALLSWLVRIDQHPPLYYLLLRGWVALAGDSALAVRLLSAFASIATLPIFYALTHRLTQNRTIALIALALLTVSPFHIHYAQEARMYALLTLLVVATIAGGRRHQIPPSPFLQAAAMLTHNVAAVFLPLVLNVTAFVLWRSQRPAFPVRRWLVGQGIALLLWLPWAWPFVIQSAGVDRRFWLKPPTLADVWTALQTFVFDFLPAAFPLADLWLIIYIGLVVWGAWQLRRQPLWPLLLLWLGLPVVGLLLISLRRPLFHPPSLLWMSPPFLIWLAAGLGWLYKRQRGLAGVLLAGLLLLNSVALRGYYADFHKEAWDEAAAYVAAHARADDLLLFNATWVQIPFDYYFRESGLALEERGLPVDLFDRGELEPSMTAADLPRLRNLIANRDGVWLIYSHDWFTDPQRLIPAALAQEMTLQKAITFTGIRLLRYRRIGSTTSQSISSHCVSALPTNPCRISPCGVTTIN